MPLLAVKNFPSVELLPSFSITDGCAGFAGVVTGEGAGCAGAGLRWGLFESCIGMGDGLFCATGAGVTAACWEELHPAAIKTKTADENNIFFIISFFNV